MTSEVENYIFMYRGGGKGPLWGFFFKIIIIILPIGESTRARSYLNFTRDGGGNRSAAAAVAVGPVYRNFFFPSPRLYSHALSVLTPVPQYWWVDSSEILKNMFNNIVLKRYLCVFSWYYIILCMCQPLKTWFNYCRYTYIFCLTSVWRLKNGYNNNALGTHRVALYLYCIPTPVRGWLRPKFVELVAFFIY